MQAGVRLVLISSNEQNELIYQHFDIFSLYNSWFYRENNGSFL